MGAEMNDQRVSGRNKLVLLIVGLFAVCVAILFTCRDKGPQGGVQVEWEPIFNQAAKIFPDTGWVLLPYPDSKYGPGAVIRLAEGRAPEWLGDLGSDCGVPPEVIETIPGATPPFDVSRSTDIGVNAVLQLQGVEAGPSFGDIRRSTLKAEDHGADSISLLAFRNWLMDPDREVELREGCLDTLSEPDTYIVREAYRVSKGSYSFETDSGAKLSLKGAEVGDYLKLSPEAKVGITNDGSLEFDQDVYLAVRRLKYTDGKVETLSDTGTDESDGDKKLLKALIEPE